MNMQQDHKVWLDREFPNQPVEVPLAGMVEESGELLHAVLKSEQQRLWGDDPRYQRLQHDLEDAVGDCAIYACSLCNTVGEEFRVVREWGEKLVGGFHLPHAVELVAVAAQGMFRKDYRAYIDEYLSKLMQLSHRLGVDYDKAVQDTWNRVKQRSRKTKKPRVVCLCGSTRFKDAWYSESKRLTHEGVIVLGVGMFGYEEGIDMPGPVKQGLDELHLRKIDMADEVRVLNARTRVCDACGCACHTYGPGIGFSQCCDAHPSLRPYIGESTAHEIAYAKLHGKPISYLEGQQ